MARAMHKISISAGDKPHGSVFVFMALSQASANVNHSMSENVT